MQNATNVHDLKKNDKNNKLLGLIQGHLVLSNFNIDTEKML